MVKSRHNMPQCWWIFQKAWQVKFAWSWWIMRLEWCCSYLNIRSRTINLFLRSLWRQVNPTSPLIHNCHILFGIFIAALLANFRLHFSAILFLCGHSWLLCSATLIRVELQLGSSRFEWFMLLLTFVATSTLVAPHRHFTPDFHLGWRLCAFFPSSKEWSVSWQVLLLQLGK